MQARVKERGNSQGIRLPKEVFRHKTLEERAAEFDGKLLLDGEYDWGNLSVERYGNGNENDEYI